MKIPQDYPWELMLEDWKQTKGRIIQSDNIVVRIRISGITLIPLISGVGLTLSEKLRGYPVPILNCNLAALPQPKGARKRLRSRFHKCVDPP